VHCSSHGTRSSSSCPLGQTPPKPVIPQKYPPGVVRCCDLSSDPWTHQCFKLRQASTSYAGHWQVLNLQSPGMHVFCAGGSTQQLTQHMVDFGNTRGGTHLVHCAVPSDSHHHVRSRLDSLNGGGAATQVTICFDATYTTQHAQRTVMLSASGCMEPDLTCCVSVVACLGASVRHSCTCSRHITMCSDLFAVQTSYDRHAEKP